MKLFALGSCFLACTVTVSAAAPAARPNIVLIVSDDHAYTDYGFMGHPVVQTPHLDRLAAQSVLYPRGYTMPVCAPSLACLLTGQLPHRHGITGNDLAKVGTEDNKSIRRPIAERLLRNPLLLPRALSASGYLTFQTGKFWNMGFAEAGFTHGMTAEVSRHGGAGLEIGRNGMKPIFDFIALARERGQPFFVWYAPMLPHEPHNPPARLLQKYAGKGPNLAAETYYAMIEWFDETCGELDRHLTAHGLAENTVVLYLADNGWDGALRYKGTRAKLTPYETGIRTPMFVRWPAKAAPRRDEETLASILDFVPTILKAAGLPVPADLPGIDLLDRERMRARDAVYVEAYTVEIADLNEPAKSLLARTVVSGWSKLIVPGSAKPDRPYSTAPSAPELFDLKSDPAERENLATQRPDEVRRLQARLAETWHLP